MRNRGFIMIVLTFLISCNKTEKFQGLIRYKLEYKVNSNDITIGQLRNMGGDSCDLIYDNENIEWKMLNSKQWKGNIYLRSINKLYYFTHNSDSILYVDCFEADEKIESFQILKNQDIILNYPCDLLIIHTIPTDKTLIGVKRTKYYYYTKELPIDTSSYLNYNYNSQNFVAKMTGGVTLKLIDSFDKFSMIYEAIMIKKGKKAINTEITGRLLTKMK